MPEPQWEPNVKYVCNAAIYAAIHNELTENGQQARVIQIDGNEIVFEVQPRKEVYLG